MVRGILLNVQAINRKSDFSLIVLIIPVYQNEILQGTCDVTIYWKIDHQLFLLTFGASCINEGRSSIT